MIVQTNNDTEPLAYTEHIHIAGIRPTIIVVMRKFIFAKKTNLRPILRPWMLVA
jgi:hypothetical protein